MPGVIERFSPPDMRAKAPVRSFSPCHRGPYDCGATALVTKDGSVGPSIGGGDGRQSAGAVLAPSASGSGEDQLACLELPRGGLVRFT